MTGSIDRKLAAIVAADVVGYSRLVEQDEEGTLSALRALRAQFVDALIENHGGRIANTAGDSLLLEFPSAVDAVRCAVALQTGMAERNRSFDPDNCIEYRVGINIGDVVAEGGDLLGDGVNVAARLEGLAPVGGICISGNVHEQVAGKLDIHCRDLGDQQVKNIERPVRAFHVELSANSRADPPPAAEDRADLVETTKPTIAVLPFDNMSGQPEQEYFVDGITEDIITELSRFRALQVIARNTTFAFKSRSVDVAAIGRQLGAQYVLEGSVRKSGDRLRITAQLIDVRSGSHLWADRYDRTLDDLFEVQEDVAQKIASVLAIQLEEAERANVMRRGTENLSAHDHHLRGKTLLHKGTKEAILEARAHVENAIELDTDYAAAYVSLGETYLAEAMSGWSEDFPHAVQMVTELAQKALELDPYDSRAHLFQSWTHFVVGSDLDLALAKVEDALKLNPNDFDNYCFKGWLSTCSGELDQAIDCSNEAFCRSPLVPDDCLVSRVAAQYLAKNYAEAINAFSKVINPQANVCAWVAATYAQLGRLEEALAKLEEFLHAAGAAAGTPARDDADGWRNYWATAFPSSDEASRNHLFDGLRKAGLQI